MSLEDAFHSVEELRATDDYQKLSDKAKQTIASLALEELLPSPRLLAEFVLLDSGIIDQETWLAKNRAYILEKQSLTRVEIST